MIKCLLCLINIIMEIIDDDIVINKITMSMLNKLELNKLPEEVNISTMTLVCKFDTIFNCKNIGKYIELSIDNVVSVKYGKDEDCKTNRSLLQKKKNVGKKKKKKSIFYNQVSLYIMVKGKGKKPVSVKLFSNGAIQMTGCKTITNATEALKKIFPELLKIKAIVVKDNNDKLKIVEKAFLTKPSVLNFSNIKDFKISMINSNFFMFSIDRVKLYNLLLKDNHDVIYDPGKHACVNIKYEHIEKTISIFVFEKGSVIITGAQTCSQIRDAYNFINKYILENYNSIIKGKDVMNANIVKYLDKKNIVEESVFGGNVIHIRNNEINFNKNNYDSDDEKPKKVKKYKTCLVNKEDGLDEKPKKKK